MVYLVPKMLNLFLHSFEFFSFIVRWAWSYKWIKTSRSCIVPGQESVNVLYLWPSTNDQTRVRHLVQVEHCREQNTLREMVVAAGFFILLNGTHWQSKVEGSDFGGGRGYSRKLQIGILLVGIPYNFNGNGYLEAYFENTCILLIVQIFKWGRIQVGYL